MEASPEPDARELEEEVAYRTENPHSCRSECIWETSDLFMLLGRIYTGAGEFDKAWGAYVRALPLLFALDTLMDYFLLPTDSVRGEDIPVWRNPAGDSTEVVRMCVHFGKSDNRKIISEAYERMATICEKWGREEEAASFRHRVLEALEYYRPPEETPWTGP